MRERRFFLTGPAARAAEPLKNRWEMLRRASRDMLIEEWTQRTDTRNVTNTQRRETVNNRHSSCCLHIALGEQQPRQLI